ncbi:head maturation protease, ClpP-related [Amaricoccus sp.]|uniref:head maturation protease, ClpP-related n=1 Tax=Amaricoccus sp. TaxID=1872485 RepID=UPI00262220CA|nr:head maturation protease, ClpP-related [uncultured Amaricoccus sp.]
MSLRRLPPPRALERPDRLSWDAPSTVISAWADRPLAAEADEAATISIYEVIGEDWWTGEGVTAKRIAAALRSVGATPVTVNINSPGGDMFEGLAIYNLLREHPAEVRVKVMGVAASAASIIAMAGDRIEMGLGSFLMIHNAWGVVVGNRNDMRATADTFDQFDGAMADIYAARSGLDLGAISALMDAESWIRASEAVEKGLADGSFDGPDPETKPGARALGARRRVEARLAATGLSPADRRLLMEEATGIAPPSDPAPEPGAALDLGAAARLLVTLTAKG